MVKPPDRGGNAQAAPAPVDLGAWLVLYGPALKRYFARKADPSHADDLVQEVFLRLQVRAEQAPTENVDRFIFTVAKRVLIDRYRFDVAHRINLHDPLEAGEGEIDELSPERIVAAKQKYARAMVAIDSLSPSMQTAFVLHRFSKLSYDAIAKRMGVTKATVQVLMQRAIRKVIKALEDEQ